MAGNLLKSIRKKLRKHTSIRETISILLFVGIIYFGIEGSLILALRSASPMMGVTHHSMTHSGESWEYYYEGKNLDPSEFPFQDGLQPGDLVFVKGVDSSDDIDIGDVIIWERNGKRIIHRVSDNDRDEEGVYFETKGDASPIPDSPKIRIEDIVGKAVFSVPYLGYPSTWI